MAYVNTVHLWWTITHEMWNRWYDISPRVCPRWMARNSMSSAVEGSGPPDSPVLSLVTCSSGLVAPGSLWASLSSPGRTPSLTDSTSHTHSSDLLKLVRVLWIINLGIPSSYWPWSISSFTEELFLKEGCQRPFGGRLRKVSASALGRSTHLHTRFPSGLRTRRAACGAGQRHTFGKRSSQKRKWTTPCLSNVQGVIPAEPPPSFLGKCKVSCGLSQTSGRMKCQL